MQQSISALSKVGVFGHNLVTMHINYKITHLIRLFSYLKWLLTNCPLAKAAIRESSPANTAPQTILANCLALSPGVAMWGPFTPNSSRHAD